MTTGCKVFTVPVSPGSTDEHYTFCANCYRKGTLLCDEFIKQYNAELIQ